ncbi:hypothetical protein [Mycoplasma sp. E35C]|uniref:hypothetical protein n=1 Tax=Mycoplasma sp. E35C TaxID=2801918 RepID=UPI001CA43E21|nr:hypothetical protein [Mycoplasma sp. E35C]QZX49209.1 hypothetical protein JJE79_00325 [Mycoplasma sp. E35C]
MKKLYLLINGLSVFSLSFINRPIPSTHRADLNQFQLINHDKISFKEKNNYTSSKSFDLEKDPSKNSISSIRKKVLEETNSAISDLVSEVKSTIESFNNKFYKIYEVKAISPTRLDTEKKVNLKNALIDYKKYGNNYIDGDKKGSLVWPDLTGSSYTWKPLGHSPLGKYPPITDFGTYDEPKNKTYEFQGKKNGFTESYETKVIGAYPTLVKVQHPTYEKIILDLSPKDFSDKLYKYIDDSLLEKDKTEKRGFVSSILRKSEDDAAKPNDFIAFTNIDLSDKVYSVPELNVPWRGGLDLNKFNGNGSTIDYYRVLKWSLEETQAYSWDGFSFIPNTDYINNTESKIRYYLIRSSDEDFYFTDGRGLYNKIYGYLNDKKYTYYRDNNDFIKNLYKTTTQEDTNTLSIHSSSTLISPKYNLFKDYFKLGETFDYKALTFSFDRTLINNGYRNLLNVFKDNIEIYSPDFVIKSNYVFSKNDENLSFHLGYKKEFLKIIDHIKETKKYAEKMTWNKSKALSWDYSDFEKLKQEKEQNSESYNEESSINNLMSSKADNYVSDFQKEVFKLLGIETKEIDDDQYEFIMNLPKYYEEFNSSTKLVGDLYVSDNKIVDRDFIVNGESKSIDLKSSEIIDKIPSKDLSRNLAQIKIDNLRFESSEIEKNNGKINNFLNIKSENKAFKIDETSIVLVIKYRYDYLGIKFRNKIADIKDFTVKSFDPLFASDFNQKIGIDRSEDISDLVIDSFKTVYENSNSLIINKNDVYSLDHNLTKPEDVKIKNKLKDEYKLNLNSNDTDGYFWMVVRVLNAHDLETHGNERNPEIIPQKMYFFKNDEDVKSKFYLVKFKTFNKLIDLNKTAISFDWSKDPKFKLKYLNKNFEINLQTDYENKLASEQVINLKINDEYMISKKDVKVLMSKLISILDKQKLYIFNDSIKTNEQSNQINYSLYSLDKIKNTGFDPIKDFSIKLETVQPNIYRIYGKFDKNEIFEINYKINLSNEKMTIELLNPEVAKITPINNNKTKISDLLKTEINKLNKIVRNWSDFDITKPINNLDLVTQAGFDENKNDNELTNDDQNSTPQEQELGQKDSTSGFDFKDPKNIAIVAVSASLIGLAIIILSVYGFVKLAKKKKANK